MLKILSVIKNLEVFFLVFLAFIVLLGSFAFGLSTKVIDFVLLALSIPVIFVYNRTNNYVCQFRIHALYLSIFFDLLLMGLYSVLMYFIGGIHSDELWQKSLLLSFLVLHGISLVYLIQPATRALFKDRPDNEVQRTAPFKAWATGIIIYSLIVGIVYHHYVQNQLIKYFEYYLHRPMPENISHLTGSSLHWMGSIVRLDFETDQQTFQQLTLEYETIPEEDMNQVFLLSAFKGKPHVKFFRKPPSTSHIWYNHILVYNERNGKVHFRYLDP